MCILHYCKQTVHKQRFANRNPHIDMNTHTYIHTYTHTHTHTHTHIHIHTYINTYTHTYTNIHTHTYTHMHTHAHIHTHTCIHTYIHTYLTEGRKRGIPSNLHLIMINCLIYNKIPPPPMAHCTRLSQAMKWILCSPMRRPRKTKTRRVSWMRRKSLTRSTDTTSSTALRSSLRIYTLTQVRQIPLL